MSIYLDNAATSFPKPEPVYDAVMHTMREIGASAGRSGHRRSLEAGRLLFEAREAVAALLSAPDSSRIIFTHNATEALNMAIRGTLNPGDHVVTTSMEHNSLLRPLYALREQGVELAVVEANGDGTVDPDSIARAVRHNTRMIAMAHVSNVFGTIQQLEPVGHIASDAGAMFLVDAAQSAGCVPLDVIACGIDLLAAPGHKGLMGPQGTGFLYAAENVALRPLLAGGTGGNSTLEEQPDAMPEGFEAGTHNMPGIAGLKAGIEFVMGTGVETIGAKERMLAAVAREKLSAVPGLAVHGTTDPGLTSGVLSFTVAGIDSSELAFMLDRHFDIAVRAGLHCAPLAHRTLGTFPAGTVRVSPGWFNTADEIAIFCHAVVECIQLIR